MFHHVERSRYVKRFIVERQFLGQPLLNGQSFAAAKRQCVVRNVNSLRLAKLREHFEICSSSTAHVQNTYLRSTSAEFLDDASHKALEYRSPADEPPMLILYAVHDRVGMLLHFAW